MRSLLGVTNHNISHVTNALALLKRKKKYKKLKVEMVGFGHPCTGKADIILVPLISTFISNLKTLNKSKAMVVVFDNPVKCEQLKPINLVDIEKKRSGYNYTFRFINNKEMSGILAKHIDSTDKITVKKETIDVIPNLLKQQGSSVLNFIQEFVYTMPNTDQRMDMQKIIYKWIAKNQDIPTLEKKIMKLGNFKKIPKALTRLTEHLVSKEFDLYKRAIQEYLEKKKSGKSASYESLSKKYKIDKFDIRYTVATLRKYNELIIEHKTSAEVFNQRKSDREKSKQEQLKLLENNKK